MPNGGIVKYSKNLILIREGEPIIPVSQNVSFKPFTVNLNCSNPINDKEIERISKIIIKHLQKE